MTRSSSRRPLIAGGVTLGIGLGGFIDGIVFHQMLQWHNMLSARLPPTTVVNLEVNMFWDGVFHLACWLATLSGLLIVWKAARSRSVPLDNRTFAGSLLAGWGLFNLVEGIIDHHLLHLHHVREGEQHLAWDLGFLGASALLLLGGLLLIRSARSGEQARASR